MKKAVNSSLIAILLFSFFGCSTILNTTTQEIEIKSTPTGARISIDNKKFGTTPQVVNIERKKDHAVKFELEGYQVYETQLTTKISFWFWGNILNGLIPGMAIDYLTGSMNSLLPETLDAKLVPVEIKIDVKKQPF
jgi:hypothetical protein